MLKYLKNRLDEKSTWVSIGAGVTAAAALAAPWCYVAAAVATLGVLAPLP